MFKKVFEYAGPHKKDLYIATFIVLLSVLMGVLPFVLAYQVISPLVMGNAVDTKYVCIRVIGVLICLILQAILYGWGLDVSHKAAYSTLLRLRTSLQKRFEAVPLGFIQDKGTGTIKKLFVDDVDSLEVLLAHSLPEGIANLMIPIAIYVAMFFIDWKLALLSLASIPISFAAMMIMYSVGMKKMGPYYMAGQKMNNTIIEYINGMEVVKVFNKDAESYERFRKDISDYRDYTLEWYKAAWPWMAIYSSLLPCTIILTLPLGAWFVLCGFSTLPDLILVLCLSLSIGIPLLKSLSFLPTMPQLNYKIAALEQVLETAPLQQTDAVFHGKNYDICFDHITFGYEKSQPGPDGQPMVTMDEVIHDISFTAKAGQKTALVGESGSGKSTLAKLLIHYYDPQQGSISIGGQKITEMSLEALNSQVSYVAQDQYLFNTSILENIRIGRPDATDEEVLEAAKKAQCIVNRIADAQKIYQALPEDGAYCLTTHLCPAHRKARIKEIRERLKIGLPCRVVSTSLIEAGVDVDFPRVYREEAGLDSVLQAAGRCNREGKRPLDESLVTVFTVQNTTPPPYMRQPAAAMKNISKRMEDITSLAAIRAYFEFYRDLYGKEDLDREKILLAFENEMLPFASVAEKVRVIESCTTPVYIPIDQGEALVERLYHGERSRTLFRKLGQYSVNVYPQQLAALREAGAVQSIDGGALYVLADPRRYDSALGLTLDQTETALFI